ncbi:MAG: hypothetical protein R3C68_04285 [Myxococcota bacterium]
MRLGFVTLTAALLLTTTASAYVLPASYLLRVLAEKRRSQKMKDLTVHFITEKSGVDHPVDERLYLKKPERLRLIEEGEGGQIYVEREGRYASGTDGRLTRGQGPVTNLLATLLAPKGENLEDAATHMLAALKAIGVDTSVVSLGRVDTRPAYVIGARVWETTKPQVWLDKASFLPVKTVVPQGDAKGRVILEKRLLEYGSPVAGNWFPRLVEDYVDGRLVRRAEVSQVLSNQDLPETLFALP